MWVDVRFSTSVSMGSFRTHHSNLTHPIEGPLRLRANTVGMESLRFSINLTHKHTFFGLAGVSTLCSQLSTHYVCFVVSKSRRSTSGPDRQALAFVLGGSRLSDRCLSDHRHRTNGAQAPRTMARMRKGRKHVWKSAAGDWWMAI